MPKAKKLPSGSWRCQVYLGKDETGKNIYKSVTSDTKKEAEYLAAEMQLKRKEQSKPCNITLREAIDNYIASKENILSPSTIRGYRTIQRNSLQSLMSLKIDTIDSYKLQRAINSDAIDHSEKTLRNAVGLIKSAIGIYLPDVKYTVSLPQKQKYEAVTLTVPQLRTLLAAIRDDEAELSILLALWLGLRASEICGLRWSDYDSNTMTLSVRSALVPDKDNNYVLKGTKTFESTRKIKVPLRISELINSTSHDTDFIINVRPATIRKRMQRICRQNGLPVVRLHDLRHANASVMLLLGIPQKYAMERGGWSSAQTMEKIYQHTFDDEKNAVDAKINDFFDGLIADPDV